ncbi:MAG: hypothetical protein ACT4OY_00970 [Alphaproteobacteria bacterium]
MDLTDIQKRNARVEADKAWETSWTRRLLITSLTYIVVAFYLFFKEEPLFYLHALGPAGGYLLSTLSIPFFKAFWLRHIYKPDGNFS